MGNMNNVPSAAPANSDYGSIAILITLATALTLAILIASHLIGPKRRRGPIKHGTYESGMQPIGTARRRFNVRYYLVAMLFLLFDVEILFFFPWVSLFPRIKDAGDPGAAHHVWATAMVDGGFGPAFFLVEMLIFIGILFVGYVYAWRKGVFQWD